MKQLSDYKIGDVVKLCEYDDMEELLTCYPTEQDPVVLLGLAGLPARIGWLPAQDELDTWDGLIALQLMYQPEEETVLVPIAVISDDPVESVVLEAAVAEANDPLEMSMESRRVRRDLDSEHMMIVQLAVETIQNAYRLLNMHIYA